MGCPCRLRLIHAEDPALAQEFVLHSAAEGFDIAVLHRLAPRDVAM
jgi:hypothetical protein